MFTRSSWAPCALCILIFTAGCDLLGDQTFTPEPVVSAVLIAGEPLVAIRLAETGPIGEFYDVEARSINNATVQVNRIGSGGQVEMSYEYQAVGSGWYEPVQADTIVGGATYALEIQAPDFPGTIRAATTVPQSFEIVHPPEPVVVYQEGPSPTFGVSPPSGSGREAVFVLKVRALDPDVNNLTPFAADLVADRDVDPEDLITANSPILNENSFTVNPDGTLQVSVVWLAFNFYGPQEITLTSLDDALIAFLESQAIQFIPTTLSPGEIPNVDSNIENGRGIFGSIAQIQTEFSVVETP